MECKCRHKLSPWERCIISAISFYTQRSIKNILKIFNIREQIKWVSLQSLCIFGLLLLKEAPVVVPWDWREINALKSQRIKQTWVMSSSEQWTPSPSAVPTPGRLSALHNRWPKPVSIKQHCTNLDGNSVAPRRPWMYVTLKKPIP